MFLRVEQWGEVFTETARVARQQMHRSLVLEGFPFLSPEPTLRELRFL